MSRDEKNEKRLQTIPEDLRKKSIKWLYWETFWGQLQQHSHKSFDMQSK